jgi:DNA polymerase III delta prime subunit
MTKKSSAQVSLRPAEVSINKAIDLLEKLYLTAVEEGEELPSVLLLGKPGVGKTVGVSLLARRLAEKTGREFVNLKKEWWRYEEVMQDPSKYFVFLDFAVTHTEPTDLSGFPRTDGKDYVTYMPLEYVKVFSNPSAAGILFLDEITLDTRIDRKSAELKILDEKQFGFRTLSPKVLLITAGNTEEDVGLAEPLPDPVLRGRVMRIYIKPPSVEEWIQFMSAEYGDKWDKKVAAFLLMYPNYLWVKSDDDAGYDPRPSPRSWTKLARLLYLTGKTDIDDEELDVLINSLISGQEAALFKTFYKTVVPSVDEIRSGLKNWADLPLEAKYLLTVQMAQKDVDEMVEKYYEILRDMAVADRECLHLLLIVMGDPRKRQRFRIAVARRLPEVAKALSESFRRAQSFEGVV